MFARKVLLASALVIGIGVAGCGTTAHPGSPGTTAHPGSSGSGGGHSDAYNDGYEEGNQHMGPDIGLGEQADCQFQITAFNIARRDSDDWIRGCTDGLKAMEKETGSGSSPTSTCDPNTVAPPSIKAPDGETVPNPCA
jgi:hypothetical protein